MDGMTGRERDCLDDLLDEIERNPLRAPEPSYAINTADPPWRLDAFHTKVVGVTFGNRQAVLRGIQAEDRLRLVRAGQRP